jgi:hypothetical protein
MVGAGQQGLTHMRNIEQPGALARPAVLGQGAFVLHRHGIAGEGDHAPAKLFMSGVKRRALQRCIGRFGFRLVFCGHES